MSSAAAEHAAQLSLERANQHVADLDRASEQCVLAHRAALRAREETEEEKRRRFTIDCHLGHLSWGGKQIHLIDTPGYPDFIGNALSALAAVESGIRPGSHPGRRTRPSGRIAGQRVAGGP